MLSPLDFSKAFDTVIVRRPHGEDGFYDAAQKQMGQRLCTLHQVGNWRC